MSKPSRYSITRSFAITTTASCLLGLGSMIPVVQAADSVEQSHSAVPLILAETAGMDNRDDRRDDRQEDRGERDDNRQDCRQEEGAGKDKRDCKQDGRSDDASGDKS